MRIAYVISFSFPNASAATRRVIGICQALVQSGAEVTIYSAGNYNKLSSNIYGLPKSVQVFYSGDRQIKKNKFKNIFLPIQFGKKMINLLEEKSNLFDNILLYSGYTPMLLRLFYFRYCHKKKIFFDAVEWASRERWWKSLYYFNVEFAMRFLVPKCDGVLCISSFLEHFYGRSTRTLRIPPIYSIPNFSHIAMNSFKNEKKSTIKILYVGNSDHDNIDLVYDVFEKNQTIFSKMQLDIAGDFKESKILKKKINKNKYKAKVIFHGQISQEDTNKLLKSSHFLIFLRKKNLITSAGFPTKLVHSFSNSIPVITNLSSDLDLYLKDDVNCIMIKNVTKEGVFEALIRLNKMTNREYVKLAKNAHKCAVLAFNTKIYSQNLINFFK